MPTPQHHIENLMRDFLPTAADKATPVIAAAGGAVAAFPHAFSDFNASVPTIIGWLTITWLLTQIVIAWVRFFRKSKE
jgi:hypothetical protein